MDEYLKRRVAGIVDGKLSNEEIEELIKFLGQAFDTKLDQDDESFFTEIAHELTGGLKELALLIIDFRKELKSKIDPEITDLAMNYIPQTADQLEGIIQTTETAANKIMDNLDLMQAHTEQIEKVFGGVKDGELAIDNGDQGPATIELDRQVVDTLAPFVSSVESRVRQCSQLISDSYVQMSFQDLTGQRVKRIMTLVKEMEQRIQRMVVSFGIKLNAREKTPDISEAELQKAVDEKVNQLGGPQKDGQGLDQDGIDDLLANL